MTSAAVLKHWRLTPLVVELQIRRIKRAQRWAENPQRHVQELAAVFGTMKAEKARGVERMGPLLEVTPPSSPWAHQFLADVKNMGQ